MLIAHAAWANGNTPAGEVALNSLLVFPSDVVVPYLLDALWDRGRTEKYLRTNLEELLGVLWALLTKASGKTYVIPCLATLCYLFGSLSPEERHPDNTRLSETFFKILENLGSQYAPVTLPPLLDSLLREENGELRQRINQLIKSYDPETLEPYALVFKTAQMDREEPPEQVGATYRYLAPHQQTQAAQAGEGEEEPAGQQEMGAGKQEEAAGQGDGGQQRPRAPWPAKPPSTATKGIWCSPAL